MIATVNQIQVADDGLVRVDGVPMFRRIERDGVVYLEFFDRDRLRAQCRGTRLVEVSLDMLCDIIKKEHNNPAMLNTSGD